MLQPLIEKIAENKHLESAEMAEAIRGIMSGSFDNQEVADFLLGLKAKGETATEVAGAAMRSGNT